MNSNLNNICHFETFLLEWLNRPVWHKTSEIVLIFILLCLCFVCPVLVQSDPPCPRPQLWVQPWQRGQQRGWRCGTWAPITSHTSHQRNIYLRSTVTVRKTHPEEKCGALFLGTLWSLTWPVCLSVCPLHREWIPLRPLEESRPESHELGDHRALLQFKRYAFVLWGKCLNVEDIPAFFNFYFCFYCRRWQANKRYLLFLGNIRNSFICVSWCFPEPGVVNTSVWVWLWSIWDSLFLSSSLTTGLGKKMNGAPWGVPPTPPPIRADP